MPLTFVSLDTDRSVILVENRFAVGAFADSGYEYLLKQWILTNRTEPRFREMCSFFLALS
jgi:hypothetical protein